MYVGPQGHLVIHLLSNLVELFAVISKIWENYICFYLCANGNRISISSFYCMESALIGAEFSRLLNFTSWFSKGLALGERCSLVKEDDLSVEIETLLNSVSIVGAVLY